MIGATYMWQNFYKSKLGYLQLSSPTFFGMYKNKACLIECAWAVSLLLYPSYNIYHKVVDVKKT